MVQCGPRSTDSSSSYAPDGPQRYTMTKYFCHTYLPPETKKVSKVTSLPLEFRTNEEPRNGTERMLAKKRKGHMNILQLLYFLKFYFDGIYVIELPIF